MEADGGRARGFVVFLGIIRSAESMRNKLGLKSQIASCAMATKAVFALDDVNSCTIVFLSLDDASQRASALDFYSIKKQGSLPFLLLERPAECSDGNRLDGDSQ